MTSKQFRKHLVSGSNKDLLETIKQRSWYNKGDVNAVLKEIKKRKASGKMRKDAGRKRVMEVANRKKWNMRYLD